MKWTLYTEYKFVLRDKIKQIHDMSELLRRFYLPNNEKRLETFRTKYLLFLAIFFYMFKIVEINVKYAIYNTT